VRRVACVAVLTIALASPAAAGTPTIAFTPFAHIQPRVDGIVWTGTRFLYVENTTNVIWSAPPAGAPVTKFATLPRQVEETRCVLSTGTHGFAPGAVFCHAPDHVLYEVSPSGQVSVFARLPAPDSPSSDGALAFDTVGGFGHALIAATGRSGAPTPSGGTVYSIDSAGRVRVVGAYHGPGGADELTVAPRQFGTAGGDVLLTVDAGNRGGRLVAVSPGGRARVIAAFPDGPNPIVPIVRARSARSAFYLTDDLGHTVFRAPASPLAAFAGDILVGGEASGRLWIVRPHDSAFEVAPVTATLREKKHSLEAMIEVP